MLNFEFFFNFFLVFNHCTAYGITCTLFIVYTESHFVDGFTLKCFQSLLQEIDIPNQVYQFKVIKV